MDLIDKIKSNQFILNDWLMNSLSLPSHKSDLPLGPYFKFIKEKLKKIKGDLLEFGVYRGDSIISTAILLKRLGIKKKIIGFDTFEGFLKKKNSYDDIHNYKKLFKEKKISKKLYSWYKVRQDAIKLNLINNHKWKATSYKFVLNRVKKFRLDKDITLIKGDIKNTVSNINKKKIAAVFMDCNLYSPHKYALEAIWDNLSSGGGIFLDDYFSLKYPGARIAIDNFCKQKKIKVKRVKNYPGDFERYFIIKN